MNLILWKEKYILGRIGLYFWGDAELILRILGAKENTFRELRNFLSVILGDQCIIFRDQGSTDPPGGLSMAIAFSGSLSYTPISLLEPKNIRGVLDFEDHLFRDKIFD